MVILIISIQDFLASQCSKLLSARQPQAYNFEAGLKIFQKITLKSTKMVDNLFHIMFNYQSVKLADGLKRKCLTLSNRLSCTEVYI